MAEFKHPINDSLKKINDRLEYLIKQQALANKQLPEYTILDNADILQLFKITAKTASTWRNEGILPYLQVKTKIFYKLSDIHNVIDANYNPSKKK
ncbi:DNA-binding protein [Winogradskyella eximia]|uniref:DNA-binding protein n=1 Tax=Winogradskyella eximia TaxID=262006 RepID=UPI0024917368|nr:DNA-binding protein [Winogradskyella eximia]|tara:strand:+ start:604 stop:888 length:285 start_codon:yes stop_codon:yes gene_type:complete